MKQMNSLGAQDEHSRLQMEALIAKLRQLQQLGERWQATVSGASNGEITLSVTLFPSLKPPSRN